MFAAQTETGVVDAPTASVKATGQSTVQYDEDDNDAEFEEDVADWGQMMKEKQGEILIRNSQRKYVIDHDRLRQQVSQCLELLGCSQWDLFIWLTTDATVRKLNREYRHKDKSTDILSFPFHEAPEVPGQLPEVIHPEEMNLGDMMVSLAYVDRQCRRDKEAFEAGQLVDARGVSGAMATAFTVEERLPLLLVHGLCHLLGHDHETDEDYERMVRLEEEILAKVFHICPEHSGSKQPTMQDQQ